MRFPPLRTPGPDHPHSICRASGTAPWVMGPFMHEHVMAHASANLPLGTTRKAAELTAEGVSLPLFVPPYPLTSTLLLLPPLFSYSGAALEECNVSRRCWKRKSFLQCWRSSSCSLQDLCVLEDGWRWISKLSEVLTYSLQAIDCCLLPTPWQSRTMQTL